ncbi:MAG: DUF1844 domain-containing protein [Planctomycetales bacterium]
MTTGDSSQEKPQIIVDEDWKTKVQREKEGQDQIPAEETPVASADTKPAAGRDAQQIPAPDFLTLVAMFYTQSLVALGMIPDPVKKEPEANLPLARHFIDLLGLLEAKTKGNLTPQEAGTLESSLHDLRMAYLELSSRPKA